jgi:8-oxo-dGTP pyrophosphatase MutT (NUDIX family)
MARIKSKAGVVVYRKGEGKNAGIQILLITARQHENSWVFPVGTIDSGESAIAAAARECWEESGYTVEITAEVGRMNLDKPPYVHHFTFFLGRATGEVADWETDRDRKWVDLADMMDVVAPVFGEIAGIAQQKLQQN